MERGGTRKETVLLGLHGVLALINEAPVGQLQRMEISPRKIRVPESSRSLVGILAVLVATIRVHARLFWLEDLFPCTPPSQQSFASTTARCGVLATRYTSDVR